MSHSTISILPNATHKDDIGVQIVAKTTLIALKAKLSSLHLLNTAKVYTTSKKKKTYSIDYNTLPVHAFSQITNQLRPSEEC